MITLGIETSCDETAVCVLETRATTDAKTGGRAIEYRILENVIHSQADLHAKYGGVFPMMAKREHEKNLPVIVEKILGPGDEKIKSGALKIDRIAVTKGPGLEPALRVGVDYAKKIAERLKVPIVGVNHMEGHILGSLLTSSKSDAGPDAPFTKLHEPALPALALLISGGHTELVLMPNIGEYKIIGRTKDDAVGEAFDKVARLLGLPYPGGPQVSELAEQARLNERTGPDAATPEITLPRPMLRSPDFDFSFSGLKTAVLYEIRKTDENATMKPGAPNQDLTETMKRGIAREFEDAVTEVLTTKTAKAIETHGAQSLIAGGGVVANAHIRTALETVATQNSIHLFLPPAGVAGDNALMIALAGALTAIDNNRAEIDILKAAANLSL